MGSKYLKINIQYDVQKSKNIGCKIIFGYNFVAPLGLDKCACKEVIVCTELCAPKSIKTLLGSTPMLFKIRHNRI